MKEMLESVMVRLLEAKNDLIHYYNLEYEDEEGKIVGNTCNIRSDFVHLDDII